jgi:hypothetical protein
VSVPKTFKRSIQVLDVGSSKILQLEVTQAGFMCTRTSCSYRPHVRCLTVPLMFSSHVSRYCPAVKALASNAIILNAIIQQEVNLTEQGTLPLRDAVGQSPSHV